MQLRELTMEKLEIPFRESFQHASAQRLAGSSVIVKARTVKGSSGLGEGCPRPYVSGESIESSLVFFERWKGEFVRLDTLGALQYWIQEHSRDIDANPAAFCALEGAILDVLAQDAGLPSLESLLGLPPLQGEFFYTAVLGVKNTERFRNLLQQYLQMGMRDFKVKIFGELPLDRANIDCYRELATPGLNLRLDANNSWREAEQAITYIHDLDFDFNAVEEPLQPRDYVGLGHVHKELHLPIILDESFLTLDDFDALGSDFKPWVINLRISKMGGILRSLEISARARSLGIPLIIGAQVGETSILTRAALSVANTCRDLLRAQEGAYGTRLLHHDLVSPCLMFGPGGVLSMGG
jgi:L-Ala-D/L-Glu epimerase